MDAKSPKQIYGEIGVDLILLILAGSPPNRLTHIVDGSVHGEAILDYAVAEAAKFQKLWKVSSVKSE